VNFAIRRAIEKKLVEPSPAFLEKSETVAYRVTTIGAYTMKELCRYFQYVDAMIVDTPIVDEKVRQSIGIAYDIDARLARCVRFADYLDSQWQNLGFGDAVWEWTAIGTSLRDDIGAIQRRRQNLREASVRPTPITEIDS
jgi:hypothetical protein